MSSDDIRKGAASNSSYDASRGVESAEAEHIEPSVPDWIFKVIEIKTEESGIHQEKPEKQRAKTNDSSIDPIKRFDRWTIFLTALLALFTGANVLVFYLASQSGAKQVEKVITEINRIADSYAANLEQNTGYIEHNIDATRVDQRAWIGPVSAIKPKIKPDTPTFFGVTLSNLGRTPGIKVIGKVNWRILKKGEEFSPIYSITKKPSVTVLFPGMTTHLRVPVILGEKTIGFHERGAITIYVFGEVEYQDIFRQAHYSKFCVYFAPDFSQAHSCETHNETDD